MAAALLLTLGACDRLKASTDRALVKMQLKPACPDPVEGRAVGAESPEGAVGCFQHAIAQGSPALLLRVTCKGRQPASCKQTDATTKEAERVLADLKKLKWDNVLGKWNETADKKVVTFAVDTQPGEKLVSTVVTCRIAEGDRWAVCEIGEASRDAADKKLSAASSD